MRAPIERWGLGLATLVFAGVGVAFLVAPGEMAGFVDVTAASELGTVELRAMYGGFELGFAAFLAVCWRRRETVPLGLLATALTLGGLGAARLVAGLAAGALHWPHPLFAAAELGGALLAALLWRRAAAPR